MSRDPESTNAVDDVARWLAPLARAKAAVPSGDTVFWRARARLTIDEAARRRRTAERPIRVFQRAIGGIAIALGAVTAFWPLVSSGGPGAGLVAVPVLAAAVAVGAMLVAESAESGSLLTRLPRR